MEINEKTNEILQDLIQINNDRIAGFEQAAADWTDPGDVPAVFRKLADDSRSYVNQLSGLAREEGLEPETGTSTSGSLHRAWLEVKATFTGNDPEQVLTECHRGEHAIKDAYAEALTHPNDIPPELYNLLTYQQQGIREGHDRVLSLLEQARAGGIHTLSDPAAEEMEQENTAELQPGYEKQNIPGMEPPEHFGTQPEAEASNPQIPDWNLDETPEPFKDIQINFSGEKDRK